jgi:hypothetical protein
VPEEERCAGWKTGRCEPAAERLKKSCPFCGLMCEDESQEALDVMINEHIKEKGCNQAK